MRLLERGAQWLGYARVEDVADMDRYLLGRWVRKQTRGRVPWLPGNWVRAPGAG